MLYFHAFPHTSLLTNLLVIPLVSLFDCVCGCYIACPDSFPCLATALCRCGRNTAKDAECFAPLDRTAPLASIDRIWVDIWDVFLFYCCLLLFCRVWMGRTAANVYIALSALLLCVSYHSYAFITDAPRRSIVFIMSVAVRQCIVWQITRFMAGLRRYAARCHPVGTFAFFLLEPFAPGTS